MTKRWSWSIMEFDLKATSISLKTDINDNFDTYWTGRKERVEDRQ